MEDTFVLVVCLIASLYALVNTIMNTLWLKNISKKLEKITKKDNESSVS